MQIIKATLNELNAASQLYNAYRAFYEQSSNVEAAEIFLKQRIEQKDSVLFLSEENGIYTGFTQLYPSFSSVGMMPIWILNDLYVLPEHRKKGIAEKLIKHVMQYSKETGRKKVVLATAHNNFKAQKIYEKIGFTKDNFYNYEIVTI
jgi:ribosomal protein S18 acetylase RimI-like enzyme